MLLQPRDGGKEVMIWHILGTPDQISRKTPSRTSSSLIISTAVSVYHRQRTLWQLAVYSWQTVSALEVVTLIRLWLACNDRQSSDMLNPYIGSLSMPSNASEAMML